jgi:hypothetical protein
MTPFKNLGPDLVAEKTAKVLVPRERPILFSAPMVRALLNGTKTQTRRVVKPQPVGGDSIIRLFAGWAWSVGRMRDSENAWREQKCPYDFGMRLWVRETTIIAPKRWTTENLSTHWDADGDGRIVQYLASQPNREAADDYNLKATPSIFMPRWACRITLEITDVRVQRLRDISEGDAKAEGVDPIREKVPTHRDAYRYLWDDINGTGAWQANPWVWALTFRRVAP